MVLKYLKTEDEFNRCILENNKVVAIFTIAATKSPHWNYIKPVFQEISEKYPDLKFIQVNVEKNPGLKKKHKIIVMPTTIMFQNGKVAVPKLRVAGCSDYQFEQLTRKLGNRRDLTAELSDESDNGYFEPDELDYFST